MTLAQLTTIRAVWRWLPQSAKTKIMNQILKTFKYL